MSPLNSPKRYAKVVMRVFISFMLYTLSGFSTSFAQSSKLSSPTAQKLGWEVSCQVYALRDGSGSYGKTFFEMIDAYSSLGIMNIEGLNLPGLKLSKTDNTTVNYKMSNEKQEKVKAYLAEKGMKMPSYYVGWGEDDCIKDSKLWEFLKKMEVKVLCCEMKSGDLGKVKELSQKYNIPLAIHNHTQGTSPVYYDPQKAIKALNDAGDLPHVGFCPDIGQWERSKIDVMKSLTAYYNSRPIHVLHARDIRGGWTDTALGTGQIQFKKVLDSLYAWKWQGVITLDPDLQSKNLLWILDSSARYIEKYAKSKVTPVLSSEIIPHIYKAKSSQFIITNENDLIRKYNTGIIYTLSGKKTCWHEALPYSIRSKNSAGVYILR